MGSPPQPVHHTVLYRRIVLPFLALLRMGASPRKLAWSISLGLVVGINPLLGSTTLLCLGLAALFRLNLAASQLANHLMYPFEIVLVIPFLRLGSRVFSTGPMPLTSAALLHAARNHPLSLVRDLWIWEWHALVLWALIALPLLPSIAIGLTPVLGKLLSRVERHEYPIVESI